MTLALEIVFWASLAALGWTHVGYPLAVAAFARLRPRPAQRGAILPTVALVVPAHIPPHREEPSASSYHRFAMVALAVSGRPRWQCLDVELRSQALSYTTDTLRHFHEWGFAHLNCLTVPSTVTVLLRSTPAPE